MDFQRPLAVGKDRRAVVGSVLEAMVHFRELSVAKTLLEFRCFALSIAIRALPRPLSQSQCIGFFTYGPLWDRANTDH